MLCNRTDMGDSLEWWKRIMDIVRIAIISHSTAVRFMVNIVGFMLAHYPVKFFNNKMIYVSQIMQSLIYPGEKKLLNTLRNNFSWLQWSHCNKCDCYSVHSVPQFFSCNFLVRFTAGLAEVILIQPYVWTSDLRSRCVHREHLDVRWFSSLKKLFMKLSSWVLLLNTALLCEIVINILRRSLVA